MNTRPTTLDDLRTQMHPRCVVCSPHHPTGLWLTFTLAKDGSVAAVFAGGTAFEGYPGWLHGGVIASLLDGAMTNCLFAHGHAALTGELKVRFRHPVAADRAATVRAWIHKSCPPLHLTRAELRQDERVVAVASAKFMELPPHGKPFAWTATSEHT